MLHKNHATLSERVASYKNARPAGVKSRAKKYLVSWPHAAPSINAMAQAGFFYDPTPEAKDHVVCFMCGCSFDSWEVSDDPVQEHLRQQPDCPWARLVVKPTQYVDADPDPNSQSWFQTRLETYVNWPFDTHNTHLTNLSSISMANAGLYFNPNNDGDDIVTCRYCELSLSDWEDSDDPREQHQKRHPDCIFFESTQSHYPPRGRPRKSDIVRKRPSRSASGSRKVIKLVHDNDDRRSRFSDLDSDAVSASSSKPLRLSELDDESLAQMSEDSTQKIEAVQSTEEFQRTSETMDSVVTAPEYNSQDNHQEDDSSASILTLKPNEGAVPQPMAINILDELDTDDFKEIVQEQEQVAVESESSAAVHEKATPAQENSSQHTETHAHENSSRHTETHDFQGSEVGQRETTGLSEPKIADQAKPQVTQQTEPQITENEPQITENEPQITENEPQVTENEPQVTDQSEQIETTDQAQPHTIYSSPPQDKDVQDTDTTHIPGAFPGAPSGALVTSTPNKLNVQPRDSIKTPIKEVRLQLPAEYTYESGDASAVFDVLETIAQEFALAPGDIEGMLDKTTKEWVSYMAAKGEAVLLSRCDEMIEQVRAQGEAAIEALHRLA